MLHLMQGEVGFPLKRMSILSINPQKEQRCCLFRSQKYVFSRLQCKQCCPYVLQSLGGRGRGDDFGESLNFVHLMVRCALDGNKQAHDVAGQHRQCPTCTHYQPSVNH